MKFFIDTANVYSRRLAPDKDFFGKDFKEYREKYAHMPYEEYLKMKREQSNTKKI